MINVSIVVSERCQASGVMAVLDLFVAANYCHGHFMRKQYDLFTTQLVGLDTYQQAYNGCSIGPLQSLENTPRPDVLVLPGIIEAIGSPTRIKSELDKYQDWFETLRKWQEEGTLIAASCSGNLLVAASNLAQGRTLTCHWAMEEVAVQMFPEENFDASDMLFDHGNMISSGGSSAINQMILFTIERLVSRELSLLTAKMMLIDLEPAKQSSFALFQPNKRHGDNTVINLQNWLEENYTTSVFIGELAHQFNISERQLGRRFKKATGETPSNYLQRLRLEHVKRCLENSKSPANTIIWDAGYEDLSSFRRLFKRNTGMTMNEYRQRFGLRQQAV
ncbi:hypothetical protein A9Q81_10435 [Gammaproteobacteria bacterium 42_54_T18]|nr:hypothetical protein A9Q81_10435 [Gammaproteobacteria bacterium 42_54_T18]